MRNLIVSKPCSDLIDEERQYWHLPPKKEKKEEVVEFIKKGEFEV